MKDFLPRPIARLRYACGPWLVLLVFGPLVYFVMLIARQPFLAVVTGKLPAYVFSGKLFTERFDTVHAGGALDQPTIGKWLFWFSVLIALTVPVVVAVRWLAERSTTCRQTTFALPVLVIGALTLCVLMFPLCMLIQYVYWMGFTPKRISGLSFSVAALVLYPWFLCWSLRRPKSIPDEHERCCDRARNINHTKENHETTVAVQ